MSAVPAIDAAIEYLDEIMADSPNRQLADIINNLQAAKEELEQVEREQNA